MKLGIYLRLALQGIGKNRKIYIPYLLASAGSIMMSYIIFALAADPDVGSIPGGASMQMILSLGSVVIIAFSAIFLLYTNSFLIKQRRREFGLLNVLGMGKGHIARVMIWESLISCVISLTVGLLGGILFAKLGVLFIFRMLGQPPVLNFSFSPFAAEMVAGIFIGIFLLLLLKSLVQVRLTNPIDLLKSASAGEKQPRANYITALLGLAALGGGYYIAVTTQEISVAINSFFIAVLLVIVGTYLCFISASIAILKLLRRNKRYYYKSNHFISVSSMIYRMRRNGAGLASICIIITMILVMLSTTLCLNIGTNDALNHAYPWDISIELYNCRPTSWSQEISQTILEEENLAPQNEAFCYTLSFTAWVKNGSVTPLPAGAFIASDAMLPQYVSMITLADYNRMMDASETLEENQLLFLSESIRWDYPTLNIDNFQEFEVKSVISQIPPIDSGAAFTLIGNCYLVLPDQAALDQIDAALTDRYNNETMNRNVFYAFDLDCKANEQKEIAARISSSTLPQELEEASLEVNCKAQQRADFTSLYGGLLFLGILLGAAFLLGAVLIIYYKQISEGYEDAGRFQILQDVGMTQREIKRSINSQILTVFFMPLIAAAAHIAFAMPLLSLLLKHGFGLTNLSLFWIVAAFVFLAVCFVYTIIYMTTSRIYYSIVSSRQK